MGQSTMEHLAKVLMENWGIEVDGQFQYISERVLGFEDLKRQNYFIKRKEDEKKINQELLISRVLTKNGIPSSCPLATKDNGFYGRHNHDLYCLYKPLPGEIVSSFEEQTTYRYGKGISLLHRALKSLDTIELFNEMDIKHQLINWAIPTVKSTVDGEDRKKLDEILSEFNENFIEICSSLPKQLIHRDPHPGNILLLENGEVGFIDFEIATIGLRIFDIGYCSTAMLMSDFNNNEFRSGWFTLLKNLMSGYQNVQCLTADELKSFYYVLIAIQLIFIAYFHKSDQSLVQLNLSGMFWIAANKEDVVKVTGV